MIPVDFIRGEAWPYGLEVRATPWPASQALDALHSFAESSGCAAGSIHADQDVGNLEMIAGCPLACAESADLVLISQKESLEDVIARQDRSSRASPMACAYLTSSMAVSECSETLSMWVDGRTGSDSVVISQTWHDAQRLRWEMATFRSDETRHQMAVAIAHFHVMSRSSVDAVLEKTLVPHRKIEVASALPALAGASLQVLLFGN